MIPKGGKDCFKFNDNPLFNEALRLKTLF